MRRRTFLLGMAAGLLLRPARAHTWAVASEYNRQHMGTSLLVLRDGQELYAEGADTPYELASGTKSFAGALALMAEREGLLALEEPACLTLPEWSQDERRTITLRSLLTLTSGLPGGPLGRPPSYREAVLARPSSPGFHYGPLPFQVFGEIMRRKLKASPFGFLQDKVLRPAGVEYAKWKKDEDGNPQLPSGALLTARNWARFGEWVRRGSLAALFEGTAQNPTYGLTWWLNRPLTPELRATLGKLGSDLPSGEIPGDLVMAAGMGKQRLYLVPSLQLVAVRQSPRQGAGERSGFSDVEMVRRIVAALQ